MRHRRIVVVFALCFAAVSSVPTVGALPKGATNTPQLCKPILKAFRATANADGNQPKTYKRQYRTAAKQLLHAAKSAPPELATALRHVGDRYHEVVEGEPLEVEDISHLGADFVTINNTLNQQCGVTT